MRNLNTNVMPTWCPGCFNFHILSGVKKILHEIEGETAIVSGIGCHAKIFDYINLPGLNSLHGRVLPTCLGLKIAEPGLNVIGFSGDGDAYAEGMEHLIHAARYNSNFKYFVFDNQVFALTTGQPTPTSEMGFKDKTMPLGIKTIALNPIKLMLASGATFVARVFADVNQIEDILREALNHKGFAFIEILQPCIIFHPNLGLKERTYYLQERGHNRTYLNEAWKRAQEFDYSHFNDKVNIPLGIFYQEEREVFEEVIRERDKK